MSDASFRIHLGDLGSCIPAEDGRQGYNIPPPQTPSPVRNALQASDAPSVVVWHLGVLCMDLLFSLDPDIPYIVEYLGWEQ